jgi:hypothetical protein
MLITEPPVGLMPAEGGGLGLFFLSAFSAQLWKRRTDSDGVASWVLGRTVELNKLLSMDSKLSLRIMGYSADSNVVVLWTPIGLFMVHLGSFQFKKLSETRFCVYHPFSGVYTAGNGLPLQSECYQNKHLFKKKWLMECLSHP